ncbi:hypothetical protein GCK72_012874 [Caenorhabditis remanei]|uniref:Uncharacterized protein n=1 Tax=Caenorhabditis remanei TaxID=31234 RepID=A0A6A5GNY8_CAERE|nr:hypothetical protein GCK72_012874 [Caenorhabditis remanei]KAF1756421.1 hypothetical protein GCK72_012874 [Caenorhabditis remanei]
MIAFILFQLNILTLSLFSTLILCVGRKKNLDGDGEVSLVQPGAQKVNTGIVTASRSASKPQNDDFSVGVPPPHIPLADKSDERTLADIESIQSEKAMIREKKKKMAAGGVAAKSAKKNGTSSSKSPAANSAEVMKGVKSPGALA